MVCANCVHCLFDDANIPSDAHEVHITVENAPLNDFRDMCAAVGHKPVLIAMQNTDGGTFHHLMTSYTARGTDEDMLTLARNHADRFRAAGFDVSRVKIETTLRNPVCLNRAPGDGRYYEAHLQIKVPDDEDRADTVGFVTSIDQRLRLSKNAFKKEDGGRSAYFVTIRIDNTHWRPQDFDWCVQRISCKLKDRYETGKVRMEFAWYDNNLTLDKEWA